MYLERVRDGEEGSSAMLDITPIVYVVDDDISVREALEALIREAGWLPSVFPSAREFLRQEAAGSPLGALLDPAQVEGLGAELERDLAPYADDDGVVLPMQTWLVTAHR